MSAEPQPSSSLEDSIQRANPDYRTNTNSSSNEALPDDLLDDLVIIPPNSPDIIDGIHDVENIIRTAENFSEYLYPAVSAVNTAAMVVGSTGMLALRSRWFRRVAFTGTIYLAGASIMSTVGLLPTAIVGLLAFM